VDISRDIAIKILKYLDQHKDFYFPFQVMNKEYSEEDDDFVEIEASEWENLHDLYEQTLRLMSKGFLERITNESLELHIAKLAKSYRKAWKKDLWECGKSEEYGLNEFICGKAEAYEDCLYLIRKYGSVES
jgi:hypothetical protein